MLLCTKWNRIMLTIKKIHHSHNVLCRVKNFLVCTWCTAENTGKSKCNYKNVIPLKCLTIFVNEI